MLKSLKQTLKRMRQEMQDSAVENSQEDHEEGKTKPESLMPAIETRTFNPHKTHLMNTTAYLTPFISV